MDHRRKTILWITDVRPSSEKLRRRSLLVPYLITAHCTPYTANSYKHHAPCHILEGQGFMLEGQGFMFEGLNNLPFKHVAFPQLTIYQPLTKISDVGRAKYPTLPT